MIVSVFTLSRAEAKYYSKGLLNDSTAMISIYCPGTGEDEGPLFNFTNPRLLSLGFHDITRETDDLLGDSLVLFNEEQAEEIVEFVKRIHEDNNPIMLLIHCYAGISRSGAVGRAVAEYTGLSEEFEPLHRHITPNPHVVSLLRRKFGLNTYEEV